MNVATEDTSSPSAPEPEIKSANQRGAARLAAVQALYQMDIGGAGVLEIVAEYEAHRLGSEIDGEQYRPADPAWFRAVVSGVVDNQRALDPVIRSGLTEDWPLSRLDATLRAILRAGAWELSAKKDVPVAVVVNEYVDVARAFFDGEEPKIVNAVLDRLARKYRGDQNPGKD
ncbi:transcription antitermination factor NusB [Hoeflea alexandrii]|nr:transcription antitermination factor NusB [Hoeflea alexandrii]MCY0153012.1 transcription antitermination factor NusB [Hoeflea alexandrii]